MIRVAHLIKVYVNTCEGDLEAVHVGFIRITKSPLVDSIELISLAGKAEQY